MSIKGYNVFRADRKLRTRGGVALYTHSSITVDDFWEFDNKYCEAGIALLKELSTVIIVIYRPPECPTSYFTDALKFMEEKMASFDESYTYMITGDFNLPDVCWEYCTVNSGGTNISKDAALSLFNVLEKHLLDQQVTIDTRGSNILDLFLTNKHDLVLDVLAVDSTISDHKILKIPLAYNFILHDNYEKHPIINRDLGKSFHNLDFTNADYDKLSSELNTIDWDAVLSNKSSSESFASIFHSMVLDICYKYVPFKSFSNHPKREKKNPNLARKKRKLLSRIFALKAHNPMSPKLQKLQLELKSFEE